MADEREAFASELLEVPGLVGIESVTTPALLASLRRLVDEASAGLSEYTGFMNYIPDPPVSPVARTEE